MKKVQTNYYIINKTIIIFIFLSFVIGYFLGENSAGGGKGDYNHIAHNYNLIFTNSFFSIDWSKYDSTRFPLHYFLFKLYLPLDFQLLKINIFVISFFIPLFYYLALQSKFNFQNKNSNNQILFLFCIIIYLSPYLRTSAYWMLEENIGIFFIVISSFFAFKSIEHKNNILIFLSFFFGYIAFYTSQNLYIFVMANFFFLVSQFQYSKNKIIYIIFLNFIFFSPILIFFDYLKLVMANPSSRLSLHDNQISINLSNILSIFLILFVYVLPFFFLEILKKKFENKDKNKFLIFFLAYFIVLILFYFTFQNISHPELGGGAIKKLIYFLPIKENLKNVILIVFSASSFVLLIYLANIYKYLYLFIFFYLPLFFISDYVFQEYFDPIFFIFYTFYCIKNFDFSIRSVYFLVLYFFIFLISSNIYYLSKLN